MTKVDYTLAGCANGHSVRIQGTGTVTTRLLQVAFVAAQAPVTFDVGLAHLVGIDVVAAIVAGMVGPHDGALVARCRADLLGEGGVELGTIAAVATVERRRGSLVCCVQLAEGRVALEPGERVTSVGTRTISVVRQWSGVALFSATTIATSRGREINVIATAFLVGANATRRRSLTVSPAAIARGAAVFHLGDR